MRFDSSALDSPRRPFDGLDLPIGCRGASPECAGEPSFPNLDHCMADPLLFKTVDAYTRRTPVHAWPFGPAASVFGNSALDLLEVCRVRLLY